MLLWPAAYKVEFLARDGTLLDSIEVVAVSEHHAGEKAWEQLAQQMSGGKTLEQLFNEQGYLRVNRMEGQIRRNTNQRGPRMANRE